MFSLGLKLFVLSSLIGCEQDKAIVEEYDKKNFFLILLKCYYHLHPLVKFERGVVDQRVEKEKNLDIFEMKTSTSEPIMKLVDKKLLIFKRCQMDVKDIKCSLQWWEKHESMFPTIGFCVKQIFRKSVLKLR
jgi:hypothetical protein